MSLTEYSPGDVLTAASLNANLAFAASSSNTNVVINGAMQVAQRGTSVANENYGAVDRWATTAGGNLGAFTQSQEADAPTGSGFRNSYKLLITTADASPAASDQLQLQQRLEGQNVQQFLKGTASAKPFSVSFWVKANVTGTYIAELFDGDNSRGVSASYTISASATWEKKTITFPADTTGAFDNDNARSLDVRFWLGGGTDFTSGTLQTTWASITNANRAVGQLNLAAATSNYWQITGVQLEAGAVATPFEFEDYGVTLRKCQRYYWRLVENAVERIGIAFAYSSSDARCMVQFPVSMRSAPTLDFATGNYYKFEYNSTDDAFTTLLIANATKNNCLIYNTSEISATAGYAGTFITTNAAARVSFSAEL